MSEIYRLEITTRETKEKPSEERFQNTLERITAPIRAYKKDWDEGYGEVFEFVFKELYEDLEKEFRRVLKNLGGIY